MKKSFFRSFAESSPKTQLFTIAATLFFLCYSGCTSAAHGEVKRDGNNFTQVSSRSAAAQPVATTYTWTDSKGNTYPIYLTKNGRAYVMRVSAKTGKEYRYYLSEEIARTICKEMGVEYKEMNTNKSK